MQMISDARVVEWMDAFAQCVRNADFQSGRTLFSDAAIGFGTVVSEYVDAEDLLTNQWSDVWPRTTDFRFDEVLATWADGRTCTVAATWSSVGTDESQARSRAGRVTLVLREDAGGVLKAVHSHFSMLPGTRA